MRKRLAGFTLIEMIGVCVIASLLLAGFLFALRSTTPKLPSRMAADLLAEVFRSAKARAVSENTIVAVAFPTDAGQVAAFQSYYLLQGWENPEITLARDLSSELESTFWTSAYDPSVAGLTTNEAQPNSLGVDLENWNAPAPADHHLIFLPSGEVTSNGLPIYEDEFRFISATGMALQTGSLPGPPPVSWAANLRQLGSRPVCATVIVKRDGQITVADQIPGSTLAPGDQLPVPETGPLPTPNTDQTAILTLSESLEVTPDPDELIDMLPPGSDALVAETRHLKMGIKVNSNRGFPVFCTWTSEIDQPGPYTGSDVGEFSSKTGESMNWNPQARRWESDWSWAPPPGSAGAIFRLTCDVRDSKNNVLTSASGALVVRSGVSDDPFRLGIVSARVTDSNPGGEWRAYLCRGDGTDLQEVSGLTDQATWVSVSPNSQFLVTETVIPGTPAPPAAGGRTRLVITRRDGSDAISIARPFPDTAGADYYPVWSPGGQYVIFLRRPGATGNEVQIMRANLSDRVGNTITPVTIIDDPAPGAWYTEPHISPTALPNGNHRLVCNYVRGGVNGSDIFTVEVTRAGVPVGSGQLVTDWGNFGCFFPYFHPDDPNRIVFNSTRTAGPATSLYMAGLASLPASPTGMTHVTLISGSIPSTGIAKFDRTGNVYFPDNANNVYRSTVSSGFTPELRIAGGIMGFFVTPDGDLYANRDYPGFGREVVLQTFGQPNGTVDRLTNNNIFDSTFGGVKLLLP